MAKTYRKDSSIVEIKNAFQQRDHVLARIRRMYEQIGKESLSAYELEVVTRACQELFGEISTPVDRPFTLRDYVVDELSRLDDTQVAPYLFYRYRYDVFPDRKELDDYPPLIQVEPTSLCNYRCVFCYQTDPYFAHASGSMGQMSLDLFKRIVDEYQGHGQALTLASRGEPLICKDIIPMLRYASHKFLALKINTNASLLTEEISHAILEAGVNTLVFSIDAADPASYQKLRVGGKLEPVIRNIQRFKEIRHREYPNSKILTRVAGVKVPGSPPMDAMVKFWGESVDQVAFVNYNPWENVYHSAVNDIALPCSDLWRRTFIWWDGTVNPCDIDFRSTLAIGRMGESDLRGLWRSERYERLRDAHLKKKRSECSPCQRCTFV
jgi:radical SAM protein with 4Fe4S-binding SPASM domain